MRPDEIPKEIILEADNDNIDTDRESLIKSDTICLTSTLTWVGTWVVFSRYLPGTGDTTEVFTTVTSTLTD